MKAYILSIAGAVLLSAVITAIAPNGKTGKFVKGTLKLLVLTIMLAPMISWTGNKSFSFPSGSYTSDESYFATCAEMMERSDEGAIAAFLKTEYSVESQATSEREAKAGFSVKKITVKITDFGIIEQDKHIDIIGKIQGALEKKYGCPAEVS